jgi:hypothetical protein
MWFHRFLKNAPQGYASRICLKNMTGSSYNMLKGGFNQGLGRDVISKPQYLFLKIVPQEYD